MVFYGISEEWGLGENDLIKVKIRFKSQKMPENNSPENYNGVHVISKRGCMITSTSHYIPEKTCQ